MQTDPEGQTPEIWVETQWDRMKLDEVKDPGLSCTCKSIARNLHNLLQRLRCPIHHEKLVDIVILEAGTDAVDFNVYGCCQPFESLAKAQLLLQIQQPHLPAPTLAP